MKSFLKSCLTLRGLATDGSAASTTGKTIHWSDAGVHSSFPLQILLTTPFDTSFRLVYLFSQFINWSSELKTHSSIRNQRINHKTNVQSTTFCCRLDLKYWVVLFSNQLLSRVFLTWVIISNVDLFSPVGWRGWHKRMTGSVQTWVGRDSDERLEISLGSQMKCLTDGHWDSRIRMIRWVNYALLFILWW